MKIWFDISNSPHILMWHSMIKELENNGHEVTITARPLSNTISLLNQHNLEYVVIGKHYGKNIFKKLLGYPLRVLQLWVYLKKKKIDVAVSQSSFHSPLVAYLLSIPSIYTNDNEHALGNLPSFLFASKVFIPDQFNLPFYLRPFNSKIIKYPGLKEGIYLWKKANKILQQRKNSTSNISKIFIRPEPATAQYYQGKINFLSDLLYDLDESFQVFILTRSDEQLKFYRSLDNKNILVPDEPIPFDVIAENCLLFIGAGGSMTREMAFIGIPTVSVYQDKLLGVDQTLVSMGKMIHDIDFTVDKLKNLLKNHQLLINDNSLVMAGEKAYRLIYSAIEYYKK